MNESLDKYVKPDGTVTLHHYAKVNGDTDSLSLDTSRFAESPWSKAEKKADPTPKTFFYLDPADQEHFLQGRTHFKTEYPAKHIYDLSTDKHSILSRIARRGGPVIQNTLKVLQRLGYHGVYYSGSFPTVAMLKNVNVEKAHDTDATVHLSRIKLSEQSLDARTIFNGVKVPQVQFFINGVHFMRNKSHVLDSPTWTITHHATGKVMQLSHPEFLQTLKKLPEEHKAKIKEAIGRFKRPGKLARNGYGYCGCGAPWLKHDKEKGIVHCPNGHSQRRVYKAKPEKLAATKAPAGGMIQNNQFHPGGQFLPKAFKRIRDVVAAKRGQVKLARAESEKVLSPEDNEVGTTKSSQKKYNTLIDQSIGNHPKSVLPTVDEIKSLASVGESTKGQYEHAGRVMTSFIGPENAKLFVAANAILSPLAKWEHHSRAALRLVRLWREAGSPKDPKAIHDIVERIGPGNANGEVDHEGKKIYPSVGFYSSKAPKLKAMLADHENFLKRIENVAQTQRGKIVEFGRAFFDPNGVPVDTHMAKATVPDIKTVQANVSHKAMEGTKESLKQLIKDTKTPHLLAQAIAASGHDGMRGALLEAQKKLVDNPATQKAYKVAVAEAAHQLGWEPRQVQETLWSAVVAIVAAKNHGMATEDVLKLLKHENAFQAWNVGGLLSTPEVLHDVGLLSKRPVKAFAAEANRPPAATGTITPSDASAFENVAARIPASHQNGAWNAIESSLGTQRK